MERQDEIASGEDCSTQETNSFTPASTCVHQRLIDDVLTEQGERTGMVRCIECGVEFPDPTRARNDLIE